MASYLSIDSSRSSGGEIRLARPEAQIGIRRRWNETQFSTRRTVALSSRAKRESFYLIAAFTFLQMGCSRLRAQGASEAVGTTHVIAATSEDLSRRRPRRSSFLAARSSASA